LAKLNNSTLTLWEKRDLDFQLNVRFGALIGDLGVLNKFSAARFRSHEEYVLRIRPNEPLAALKFADKYQNYSTINVKFVL
jgi:hypothetical protein